MVAGVLTQRICFTVLLCLVAQGAFAWRVKIHDDLTREKLGLGDTIDTIPAGVNCTETVICNGGEHCSIVCKTGTVTVTPWLAHAIKTQTTLARRQNMCYVLYPGTHNSAITLANGYGNEDYVYTKILQLVDKSWYLRTNNQYLSLTDQLNLGVRFIELDTHFVDEELRIAHCGGAHSPDIDGFIELVNKVIHDLGLNVTIYWDTETIGCDPSLSSIPVDKQRRWEDAIIEVADWLDRPENAKEFILVFFDDQEDLLTWGKVPELVSIVKKHFGSKIYTPPMYYKNGGKWPDTIDDMVKAGTQVLFMSGEDYGTAMNSTIFSKYGPELCQWQEPSVDDFVEYFPDCTMKLRGGVKQTFHGSIIRPNSAALVYGPINGGGLDKIRLNATTLPPVTKCNVNVPCPDLYVPSFMEAQVWSWALGQPTPGSVCASQGEDGRWVSQACSTLLPVACRVKSDLSWAITEAKVSHNNAQKACTAFSSDAVFDGPTSGFDNGKLNLIAKKLATGNVWINVSP